MKIKRVKAWISILPNGNKHVTVNKVIGEVWKKSSKIQNFEFYPCTITYSVTASRGGKTK